MGESVGTSEDTTHRADCCYINPRSAPVSLCVIWSPNTYSCIHLLSLITHTHTHTHTHTLHSTTTESQWDIVLLREGVRSPNRHLPDLLWLRLRLRLRSPHARYVPTTQTTNLSSVPSAQTRSKRPQCQEERRWALWERTMKGKLLGKNLDNIMDLYARF